MDYTIFILICLGIMAICGLVDLLVWVMDCRLSLTCTVILLLTLIFFLIMGSGMRDEIVNGEPVETTCEVVETYILADGSFEYCRYIDTGIIKIQAEEWVLEIPDGEYELCMGNYSVELCSETKTYKYGFIIDTVEKNYYKVYMPR